MSILQRLKQKIIDRDYYLSAHAEEELRNDRLHRSDLESAICKAIDCRKQRDDPQGPKYRLLGPANDGRLINVICRFDSKAQLIIITTFAENGTFDL